MTARRSSRAAAARAFVWRCVEVAHGTLCSSWALHASSGAGGTADATLTADPGTWTPAIADDVRGGMRAYQSGRLAVRRPPSGRRVPGRDEPARRPGTLTLRTVITRRGRLSTLEAGVGPPVLAIHGLGATKGSLLPTVDALADHFRVIAVDLPGFGDSDKPIERAVRRRLLRRRDDRSARRVGLDRANVIGNSLGGRDRDRWRLREPERVDRLVLLAPSLAWRRPRRWAPALRLVRRRVGARPACPRPVVEAIVHRLIPGADEGWTAAGVDEFLRAYLTPAGRAAFYAAARQIYLEAPHGEAGFWTRLRELEPHVLFVWGRRDTLVPIAFARHVTDALPHARHLELDCGHVPQVERPNADSPDDRCVSRTRQRFVGRTDATRFRSDPERAYPGSLVLLLRGAAARLQPRSQGRSQRFA